MAYRIRARAGAELEVEVDTAEEVQLLLQIVRRGGQVVPLLSAPTPARETTPRRASVRKPSAKRARAAAPAAGARGSLDDQDLLQALKAGPVGTGVLSRKLKVLRPRVTKALNALAARGFVHATGVTAGRRWHLGAAAPAATAPRRAV